MTITDKKFVKKQKRRKRIKGICAAALALGVTRGHLWAVLTARRSSAPLTDRYINLKNADTKTKIQK